MENSRKRAVESYRSRLRERGLARFEVLGLGRDRSLIRSLALKLAQEGPEAARLRASLNGAVSGDPPNTGGILAALRRSPLVGADIHVSRADAKGRAIDL